MSGLPFQNSWKYNTNNSLREIIAILDFDALIEE